MSDAATGPGVRSSLPARAAVVVVAVLGGLAATLLSSPPPSARGAARLASPEVLLGAFDAVWVVALAWPRAGSRAGRATAAGVLLAVGAPFHVALAAAAGGGGAHLAAVGSIALAAAVAGLIAGAARAWPALLAATLIAAPLAGYALTDLAGLDALALVRVSPLVAPVLLARDAAGAAAGGGLGAAAALLVAAGLAAAGLRPSSATAALVLVLFAAPAHAMPAPHAVTVLPGGHVREGRPVVVRAPGARRVRASGGPWAGPVGARGDEFVLLGARPRGDVLEVEVERGDGASSVAEVAVRPLAAAGRWTAVLDGRSPEPDERGVRPEDLPTVPEAWLVFDAVAGVPAALPEAEARAIEAWEGRPAEVLLSPTLLPPSPPVHRALAAIAAGAPRMPRDVSRVLLVLAALVVVLALVGGGRRSRAAPWLVAPALVALGWMLLAAVLPAGVRAAALVLDDGGRRLALVRLSAVRPGEVAVRAPGATGALAPVRWGSDDPPPEGVAVGHAARVRLDAGHSLVLAIPLPAPAGDAPGDPSVASGDALRELDRWLRRGGLRAGPAADVGRLDGVTIEGARLQRVVRTRVER